MPEDQRFITSVPLSQLFGDVRSEPPVFFTVRTEVRPAPRSSSVTVHIDCQDLGILSGHPQRWSSRWCRQTNEETFFLQNFECSVQKGKIVAILVSLYQGPTEHSYGCDVHVRLFHPLQIFPEDFLIPLFRVALSTVQEFLLSRDYQGNHHLQDFKKGPPGR